MDTTSGRWKDTGGRGIVPLHRPEASTSHERTSFTELVNPHTSDSPAIEGVNTDATRHHHIGNHVFSNPLKPLFWGKLSPRGLFDRLLKKTVKRDNWIYVSVGVWLRIRNALLTRRCF